MAKRVMVRRLYLTDPDGGDEATGFTGGFQYRVRLAADIAAIAALGFAADDPAQPTLPSGLKMRYVLAKTADGTRQRKLPCGNIAAPAFAAPGVSIVMQDWNDTADITVTTTGKVGESATF